MNWFFRPEFIVTLVCIEIIMFGVYYSARKRFSIPRRLKKLDSSDSKNQYGKQY